MQCNVKVFILPLISLTASLSIFFLVYNRGWIHKGGEGLGRAEHEGSSGRGQSRGDYPFSFMYDVVYGMIL